MFQNSQDYSPHVYTNIVSIYITLEIIKGVELISILFYLIVNLHQVHSLIADIADHF